MKKTIGERIKQLRLEKNLTLEQLAERIGSTRQTVHRYETGEISNIPSDKIELIAKSLMSSPAYIMGWSSFLTKKDFELEIQQINLHYMFQKLVSSDESIIKFFEHLFDKEYSNNRTGKYNSSFFYFHSVEELICRYQDLYNKKDLITYEEQKELNRALYLKSYDLSDYNLKFSLQEIINFLNNPIENYLYKSDDNEDTVFYSCIEAERHIKIFKANNDIDRSNYSKLLDKIASLLSEYNSRLIDIFNESLRSFLSVKYEPVNLYGDHNANLAYFADKPELLELYKDIHESESLRLLFDSAKNLKPEDLEIVLNLIKRLETDEE